MLTLRNLSVTIFLSCFIVSCLISSNNNLSGEIYSISLNPDGKYLAVTTSSGIWVYRFPQGEQVFSFLEDSPYSSQGVFSYISWSPNGTYLAVGRPLSGIHIWNSENWTLITEQNYDEQLPNELPGFTWSPDSNHLALGKGEGTISIWDRNSNIWHSENKYLGDQVSLTWSVDDQLMVLGLYPKQGLFDVEDGIFVKSLTTDIDGKGGYALWAPDGKNVFVSFDLGGSIIDIETKKKDGFSICCYPKVAWSMDGRYFAAASYGNDEIQVWDTITNEVIKREKQESTISALTWTPKDTLLAAGISNNSVVFWDTESGRTIFEIGY